MATCCDCQQIVKVREGLSDKPENLGLNGTGWLTRHKDCAWKAQVKRHFVYRETHHHAPDPFDDGFDNWVFSGGMTESEFFGGDVGDRG